MRHISKNNAHHMSVSLSDFYFSSSIAILGGFKGMLHATGDVVYFLYAILGGFKGMLHATGDVVYFLYAILGGLKGMLHATGDVVYFLYAINVKKTQDQINILFASGIKKSFKKKIIIAVLRGINFFPTPSV